MEGPRLGHMREGVGKEQQKEAERGQQEGPHGGSGTG